MIRYVTLNLPSTWRLLVMHLVYRGVNEAFREMIKGFHTGKFYHDKSPVECIPYTCASRYGEVMMIEEPVIITYQKPIERVLFNQARDCNVFFHLFEALYMLAGRQD